MASTASEIIALAQSTKALSTAQLQKILELAPKMTGTDLENLKNMILAVQAAEMKTMKRELDVRQKANSACREWHADKARTQREANETVTQTADLAYAENLFPNI